MRCCFPCKEPDEAVLEDENNANSGTKSQYIVSISACNHTDLALNRLKLLVIRAKENAGLLTYLEDLRSTIVSASLSASSAGIT